jgi:mRNA interferase MazF
MPVRRGEIYWVAFDPVKGSEQGGFRPALVVQNDTGNRYGQTTVVVAITRTIPPKQYPFTVIVDAKESGLPDRSTINCAQMATIQQRGEASRIRPSRGESEIRPIGKLGVTKMREVDQALRYNLGLGK